MYNFKKFFYTTDNNKSKINVETVTLKNDIANDSDFLVATVARDPYLTHIDIYNKIIEMGNTFDVDFLKEFKYQVELNYLLNYKTPRPTFKRALQLNRYICASLIAQSLFCNNVSNINFNEIKIGARDNDLLKTKLLSILEYINVFCSIIRNNPSFGYDEIDISVNTNDKKLYLVKNTQPIDFSLVTIKQYDPAFVSMTESIPDNSDLVIIYAKDLLGSKATGVRKEDLQFLQYPELYAIPHYFNKPLGDDQSLLLKNLIQYNSVKRSTEGIEFVRNLVKQEALAHINLLAFTADDNRFDNNSRQFDKKYVDSEINRLASGVAKYVEQSKARPIIYTGPYGSKYKDQIFQFYIELLVAMKYRCGIFYCAADAESINTITDTLSVMKQNNISTVGRLYKKLVKYNFNIKSQDNFKK
ncbi:poly ADP-ribose glycohydrolase [Apocheima cinerarium nucleopolyhedrovirus]|uniref:poly ADP-ribose glycohydrolase n=1 Tax=Apocheima cinerarium nucleopolyhedrovirus TaxID=307461 RepID=UPI0001D920A8|nr:poly ADP-ribose glycohydrolase [Apocheima cinerarium nucleopolyhedrovirus]ADB84442.1 poly ADP-ribose glycohydrolase [Apocheima cinerarium nucleopolyhedrovirus]